MKNRVIIISSVLLTLILAGHSGEMSAKGEQSGFQPQLIKSPGTTLSSSMRVDTDFGKMPLYFIPNRGQMDKQVAYYVQGKDKTIYFTEEGITLALVRAAEKEKASDIPGAGELKHKAQKDKIGTRSADHQPSPEAGVERWAVKLDFVGANPDVGPVGQDETGAIISYFKGNPEDWHAGLPTCSKIVYRDLWPGIDLVYYGTVNKLKYEFIIHPGADPSTIRLAYRGAESVAIDESGRLQVTTPAGGLSDDVPVAYQEVRGEEVDIPLSYQLHAADQAGKDRRVFGFEVGAYDPAQILVLDPAILVYCGYVGGLLFEMARGIALDKSGNAYITGYTNSLETNFPVIVGPDLTMNDGYDAFVAKVNASGTALVYCGYIGGTSDDRACGIAVDGSGNAYVTGYTSSTETTFPEVVGPDLTYNSNADAFVAKVNTAGTALVYCGYIGGSLGDYGYGIVADGSGNAYITGETYSTEATFPEVVGPDLTYNSNADAFVTKVNATGTALVYCGYIGGSGNDFGHGIALDGSGNAYITGDTGSTESTFPVAVGPDLTHNGGYDAFVAKVSASGASLTCCGYIGGSGYDYGRGIAVDRLGNSYVSGYTSSNETTFPEVVGPDLTQNGVDDAFVAKVVASGISLAYCGYIGGSDNDYSYGIGVDGSGNAYVIGYTFSTETTFPVTAGPDLTHNGITDNFVAKVNASGTTLVYCGYVGGSGGEAGHGVAVDGSGNAYVAGLANSTESTFPVTAGPDLTHNGSGDAFVAKVYYFEQPVHKHVVGDFDGDGTDELVMDFGASGAWMWNGGTWSQLSTNNPENMIAFNIDGNADDELAVDLGSLGLWMWNGGAWSQLSATNPEYLIAADTNNNGIDELIIDFGVAGLKWRQEAGNMFEMTGVDPQNIIAVDTDHDDGDEVVADFGTMGMWVCDAGNWSQLTAADSNTMATMDTNGLGNQGVASGLGGLGVWLWDSGMWSQLSGIYADQLTSGKMVLGGGQEIAGDFGLLGMWLWGSSAWMQLSGVNPDDMIVTDVDGNVSDEVAGDFALLGLWLWNSGSWTQLSGVNPEGLLAGDIDGDGGKELIVDFGSLGVWLWNGGNWSQLSALNPD